MLFCAPGKIARQRLVEMVVRVDEARQHDLAAEVDHRIGGCRQLGGRPDLLDDAVLGIEAGIAQFPSPAVHGDENVGVPGQKCRHRGSPNEIHDSKMIDFSPSRSWDRSSPGLA